MSRMPVRSVTSTLTSATRGRVRLPALVAAVVLALATGIFAVTPPAQADDTCRTGYLYHFQNRTKSGKSLKLEGYSGPKATGNLMITCSLHIPRASSHRTRGGEVWIPHDVTSVKITSWSDHRGDPVETGYVDNNENKCFRILYVPVIGGGWFLSLVQVGPTCNNK
jgi:hypothetical protein